MLDNNKLSQEIRWISGIGEFKEKILHKMGINCVADIFEYFPRLYINRNTRSTISSLVAGETAALVLKIISIRASKRGGQRKKLEIILSDSNSQLVCTWFKWGTWLTAKLEVGSLVWVSGTVSVFAGHYQMTHPHLENMSDTSKQDNFWQSRKILPVYPLTNGITSASLRTIVYNTFKAYHTSIVPTLPRWLLTHFGFEDRKTALQRLHFPNSNETIELAKKRFVFEEFFYYQLLLIKCNRLRKKRNRSEKLIARQHISETLLGSLKYRLTDAQKKVRQEIVNDVASGVQMNRLLQGDVGSGKTIVSVLAMCLALENGFQVALLAPTELLAEQHYKVITQLLAIFPDIHTVILKGGAYKGKKADKEAIRAGKTQIIIGTHALLQKDVIFSNLALVIIDEQHRFGVEQRALLSQKGKSPHILHLSATPIPRSLAQSVYGDLDVSIIDELPPGRQRIQTVWHGEAQKNKIYNQINEELKAGRQAYIVCPLVEESEKMDLLDATRLYEYLSKDVFPQYQLALLHGRLKQAEKDTVMQDFIANRTQILVSTTVIEVGIDVPNASVMMVEHAERFGLSQLHQLRGRIGRGSYKSTCYLIGYYPMSHEGRERLTAMVNTDNGFEIAEIDLKIRGAGDLIGTKQSGLPLFKHASLTADGNILNEARTMASLVIREDPDLSLAKNRVIKEVYAAHYQQKEELYKY